MRQFRILFFIFSLVLLVPIGFLVERALRSVALERGMRHQVIAERIFDEMERSLSRLLEREEQRSVDQYLPSVDPAAFPFVIGYFEVDPDGTIRSSPTVGSHEQPTGATAGRPSPPVTAVEIERIVGAYWKTNRPSPAKAQAVAQTPGTTVEVGTGSRLGHLSNQQELGDKLAVKNEVSAFDALRSLNRGVQERVERQKNVAAVAGAPRARQGQNYVDADAYLALPEAPRQDEVLDSTRLASERAPMIGKVIDSRHLMLSRTVVRERQAYRQGVLVDVEQLGTWLRAQGLGSDGLAEYASVSFATPSSDPPTRDATSAFMYQHRFAEPFADLTARLSLRPLPGVASVTYVYALCGLLFATGVLGLAALYRMVSVVVNFAQRRSNFVAAVSHELKTPLTAIRMYGEMLRDGMVTSDAKRNEYYRHITAESERLSRLINNVLEFSRLEQGRRDVVLVADSVGPVVREVAELLRPHVEGQGFELREDVDADVPPVRFERDALMQVLWNLVDNAVKYAREASPKQIALRCWHDGNRVHITVRDHGPGVPSRHLGKIFEPFYRGENELTRRSKGTGLGLALVRGLVERMGARVSGRNVANGGFEVDIAFPALPPAST